MWPRRARLMARRDALGSPPPGDPGDLARYAQFILDEAEKVLHLARREASLPGPIDFQSDGALRLFSQMGEVADSYLMSYCMLEQAAHAIKRESVHLKHKQDDWNNARYDLDGAIADLDRRAASKTA
jgi:hypothetical protein